MLEKILNKIYDDLESRVCKNCAKYRDGKCRIFQGARCKCTLDVLDDKNFGCNRFERRVRNENLQTRQKILRRQNEI